jgi:hypothetical protein
MIISRRIPLVVLALLAVTGCPAQPKPGPNPPAVPPGSDMPSISGQSYNGTEGVERVQLHFLANGKLHYRDAFGWWENGTWQQNGASLTMTAGEGFVTYQATIANRGEIITGQARNQKGATWSIAVQKGRPHFPSQLDLVGQSWGGTEADQCVDFHFLAGGKFDYDIPATDTTPAKRLSGGTYTIDGTWVDMEIAGDHLKYYGAMRDDTLAGNVWTRDGKFFAWTTNKDKIPQECDSRASKPRAQPQVADITGAVFTGDNGGDQTTMTFGEGGKLTAKDAEGSYEGTWSQNGAEVQFELNQRFAWYSGTLAGNTLSGDGHNKNGLSWKFSFTRK